jgi:DNA-binding NarL/FixJ family response regulator
MSADRHTLYPAAAGKVRRREQVLLAIWEGKGTKEIGAELGISPKTVEYHRAELYRVFGVRDAITLCRRAIVLGFIKPPRVERNVRRKQ